MNASAPDRAPSTSLQLRTRGRLERRLHDRCRPVFDDDLARSALVIAPHFDDETLGCGGTLARKLAAGATVTVLFLSDGTASHRDRMDPERLSELRWAEALAAAAELGLPESAIVRADLPDGRLQFHRDAAVERITDLISQHRPVQVFVPHRGDGHADHVAATDAGFEASARSASVTDVWEYPVWHWQQWPWVRLASPLRRRSWRSEELHGGAWRRSVEGRFGARFASSLDRVVDVAPTLDRKLAAIDRYESQLERVEPDWAVLSDVSFGDFLTRLRQGHEYFRVRGTDRR